ncbi:GNAT family N-acetyltransferase [Cohnella sp. GCM10027633]|uniref:GNAT family N-acetyltransferase n=1 Tax=unclassified Cohnella TaxID=2636738 RepID=UPI003624F489
MPITLQRAADSDARSIFDMQVQAFQPLLDRYQDFDTNPANETIDRVIGRINDPNSAYYMIMESDAPVGAIRIVWKEEARYCISPLFIKPDCQGRGIAQLAIAEAERMYPQAITWELVTLLEEARNCYLYEKLGYRKTGEQTKLNENATLIHYKKPTT